MSSPSPSRPSLSSHQTPPLPQQRHLLSLKVLRSTRPSLVPRSVHEQTYEEGAGARAFRELELGGGGGGLLKVPAEFGRIYLGETFSAVLSLSNDSPPSSSSTSAEPTLALSPTLKIEMHTSLSPQQGGQPTNKHLLFTTTSSPSSTTSAGGLAPGSSEETVVAHELKELGQHALVCTVQYGQEVEVEVEGGGGRETRVISRSFRKVYKFDVLSPLSVRTKAHSPLSLSSCATSSLSPTQRNLIFLEVQVHNHHASALFFERMRFEPLSEGGGGLNLAPGFADPNEGLFDAPADALLAPGGVRQFLYVLEQSEEERRKTMTAAAAAVQGGNQGLGRLDIIWRTPNGEIGRLQSSTLGRRIPPPPHLPTAPPSSTAQQPPPPAVGGASPALPPLPPSSALVSQPAPPPGAAPLRLPSAEGLAFDFTVDDFSPSREEAAAAAVEVEVDRPFRLNFRLRVSCSSSSVVPSTAGEGAAPSPAQRSRRRRRVRLAVQHVQYHPSALAPSSSSFPSSSSSSTATVTANARPTHASQPSTSTGGALSLPGSFAPATTTLEQQQQRPLAAAAASTRASLESFTSTASTSTAGTFPPLSFASPPAAPQPKLDGILLPPPFPLSPPPSSSAAPLPLPSPDIVRLGPSLVDLGWVEMGLEQGGEEKEVEKEKVEVRWRMKFLPLAAGLKRVGGVRVLLVDAADVDEDEEEGEGPEKAEEGETGEKAATVVGEWAVVGEVWVASGGQ